MVRMELDLPNIRVEELDRLMEEAGLATRTELFNHALSLFDWAVEMKKAGRVVGSVDDERRIQEVVLPSLENVAARRREGGGRVPVEERR